MTQRVCVSIWFMVLLISGCATTGEQMRSMELGMTKAAVIRDLGRPDGAEIVDGRECMLYYNRLISGWAWDRADYQLCFENGKLAEYKALTVREKQPIQGHHVIIQKIP